MEPIFKYAWIAFLIVPFINYFYFKDKFNDYIIEKPERERGYNLIRKSILIYGLIPWIIVAIGCLSGQTESVFDYFQPAKLNPFVLLFHFSVIIIWIMLIRFIFFKDGAQFLEDHPGIIHFKAGGYRNDRLSKKNIKLFFLLSIAGGIAAMVMMWVIEFPLPK